MDQKRPQMQLQQSEDLDFDQLQMFLNPKKSKSNDSMLGKLIIQSNEIQKRPLLFDIPDPKAELTIAKSPISVFRRKIKKPKKKNQCDYRKNICGYITKKVIREFVSQTFLPYVKDLCAKHNCDYEECRSYYLGEIQSITGPTHVQTLLHKGKSQGMNHVFREFFEWFLKNRYLRYLLAQGKMANKNAYIQYKNMYLLSFLSEQKPQKVETSENAQSEQQSEEQSSSKQKLEIKQHDINK